MSKRKYLYIILIAVLTVSTAVLSNKHFRWLAFNGVAAAQLSDRLLSGEQSSIPDWAIDLVIVVDPSTKVVTFSEHHSLFSYAYSLEGAPMLSGYSFSHIVGAWYVAKIKT